MGNIASISELWLKDFSYHNPALGCRSLLDYQTMFSGANPELKPKGLPYASPKKIGATRSQKKVGFEMRTRIIIVSKSVYQTTYCVYSVHIGNSPAIVGKSFLSILKFRGRLNSLEKISWWIRLFWGLTTHFCKSGNSRHLVLQELYLLAQYWQCNLFVCSLNDKVYIFKV